MNIPPLKIKNADGNVFDRLETIHKMNTVYAIYYTSTHTHTQIYHFDCACLNQLISIINYY